jgi:hypothetical protein
MASPQRTGATARTCPGLVRRSPEAAFALRAAAPPQYEGRALAKRRRGEGGSESVKVAQYPADAGLGMKQKEHVRPVRSLSDFVDGE